MTELLLVRHASHDRVDSVLCGRMPGVVLGAAGAGEARRLAGRLADEEIAAVYSSPLERAVETAEAIAAGLGMPLRREEGLNEVDYGRWTGRRFADLAGEPEWAAWNARRDTAFPPGGESIGEALARAREAVDALAARHAGERIVAVSHAEIIRVLILGWLGLSPGEWMRLAVLPARFSRVRIAEMRVTLMSLNEGAA